MELTPTRNTRLAFENLISSLTAKPKKVIFISCKIGEIKEIEPYKLWTVAERFGGKNVKKVLIASDFKRDNEKSENSFLNRAKEMGITFIANATEMTPTQWKNVFKNMV